MTPADIRRLAEYATAQSTYNSPPIADALLRLADVMEEARSATDYLLDDDYKTSELRKALARVEALKL